MPTLITGGTGFLGSTLARYLAREQGEHVVLFDAYPRPEAVKDIADRVTIVRGEISELQDLVAVIRAHSIDRIAHMAFSVGTPLPGRLLPYLRMQCMGTANVFEMAHLHGIRRVVNASSVAIYGDRGRDPGRTVGEDEPPRPRTLYAANKVWAEQLAQYCNETYGMEIISFRVGATLGFGRFGRHARLQAAGITTEGRGTNLMASPEVAVLEGKVTMPPDDEMSDFIYRDDVAHAWALALAAPMPTHSVFNLTSECRPVGDMTRRLRELLPHASISVGTQQGGTSRNLMDTTRLFTELGYKPRVPLERGLGLYLSEVQQALADGESL